jgi:hypothetical protein
MGDRETREELEESLKRYVFQILRGEIAFTGRGKR